MYSASCLCGGIELKIKQEIDKSIEFLKSIGSSTDNWAMCYPYGGYNQSLIDILKRKGCVLE